MTLKAFRNPVRSGESSHSLMSGIDARYAPQVIQSPAAFLKAANRDYQLEKKPSGVQVNGHWEQVQGRYHLVRTSDKHIVSPQTVSEYYKPTTLLDLAKTVRPWVEAGWAIPEGVYEARDGSLELFILRIISETEGPFQHYMVLRLPHGIGTESAVMIDYHTANQSKLCILQTEFDIESEDIQQQVQTHITELNQSFDRWAEITISRTKAESLTDSLLGIKRGEEVPTRKTNLKEAILKGFELPEFGTLGKTARDWLLGVAWAQTSQWSPIVAKSRVSERARLTQIVTGSGSITRLQNKAVKLL